MFTIVWFGLDLTVSYLLWLGFGFELKLKVNKIIKYKIIKGEYK